MKSVAIQLFWIKTDLVFDLVFDRVFDRVFDLVFDSGKIHFLMGIGVFDLVFTLVFDLVFDRVFDLVFDHTFLMQNPDTNRD